MFQAKDSCVKYNLPGSSCTNVPKIKSITATAKIRTRISWNLITHFTPDNAIARSANNTARPIPLIAHVSFQPNRLEKDSAKPMQYIEVATACQGKEICRFSSKVEVYFVRYLKSFQEMLYVYFRFINKIYQQSKAVALHCNAYLFS